MARTGDIVIPSSAVMDAAYIEMVDRRNALLYFLSYEQFIRKQNKLGKAVFGFRKPSRPLKEICIQYGGRCEENDQFTFDSSQKNLLIFQGKSYGIDDLDTNNIHWQALKTETFNHVMALIDAELQSIVLNRMAIREKKRAQDLVEERIVQNSELSAQAHSIVSQLAAGTGSLSDADRSNMVKMEIARIRTEKINEYIQKNEIKLPIEVSVEIPDMDFSMKWDWVAHLGPRDAKIRVVFVSDFKSFAARQVISQMRDLHKLWPNVVFGHRPFFNRSDRYQLMIGEMGLCVWNMFSPKYWDFLNKAADLSQDNFETEMYKILDELEIGQPRLKQCFLERKYRDAMEYHLQWAEHYKILAGPVAIIGREAYIGPMGTPLVSKILSRQ